MLEHAVNVSIKQRFEIKTDESLKTVVKFWKYSNSKIAKVELLRQWKITTSF